MGLFDIFKKKETDVVQQPVVPVQQAPVVENDGYAPVVSFRFGVEDVFSISGRGTVVTGRVVEGTINVGEEVTISGTGKRTVVTGIEQFRKNLNSASMGDNAGLLLRGVDRSEVVRGDILYK